MRSLLFVPGDSEKKLEKGFRSGADVVIVDLEDSVAPASKVAARAVASHSSSTWKRENGPKIYVRVNDLSTGLTDDDLAAAIAARPDGIMLPKCNAGADVSQLSAMLRVHEADNGVPDGQHQDHRADHRDRCRSAFGFELSRSDRRGLPA